MEAARSSRRAGHGQSQHGMTSADAALSIATMAGGGPWGGGGSKQLRWFRHLIRSFLGRMTAEQLQLLKTGRPDETTSSLLVELLMSIVVSLSNGFLTPLRNINAAISWRDVRARLGGPLSKSFAEVLGVQDNLSAGSEASQHLEELVGQEVSDSINSLLAAGSEEEEAELSIKRITPPHRLRAMLRHTLSMLSRLMRNVGVPKLQEPRQQATPPQHGEGEEQLWEELWEELEEELEEEEDAGLPVEGGGACDVIRAEVDAVTQPLLEEVGGADLQLLQSHFCLQIKKMADNVAGTAPEMDEESAALLRAKVREFLAKCRAKAWIVCLAAQQERPHPQSQARRRHALRSLLQMIETLFEPEGGACAAFPRLKAVLQGRAPLFTKQMSEAINRYGGEDGGAQLIHRSKGSKTLVVAAVHARAMNIINIFLSVISWWLETQAELHVERLTRQLGATGGAQPAHDPAEEMAATSGPAPSRAETRRAAVLLATERLVSRLVALAKVTWAVDQHAIAQRLFLRLWSDVGGAERFHVARSLEDFPASTAKRLCWKWGNAKAALLSLTLQEDEVEEFIASALRRHLTAARRRGRLSRLRPWLAAALHALCTCRWLHVNTATRQTCK